MGSIGQKNGWHRRAVAISAVVGASSMLFLLLARGVWLDEIWTRWITDPGLTLSQAIARWSFEPHPPTYYFYIWSLRHLIDASIPALRASNIPMIVPLLIAARDCRVRTNNAGFAYGYCTMALLSTPVIVYFAELRAYYGMTMLYAALLALLATSRFDAAHRSDHIDKHRLTATAITAMLASSLHYLSFAVVAITLGLEILRCLTQRAFKRSLAYTVITLLCAVAIAPTLLSYVRLGPISQATAEQGANGLAVVGRAMMLALSSNILVLALVVWRHLSRRHTPPPTDRWLLGEALMAACCGAAIIASFLLLNAFKPFLTPRYLLQLCPLACLVAASLAARFADRVTTVVTMLNGMLAALVAVVAQGGNKRWEHNVGVIRTEIAACPATRVFALDPFELGQSTAPPRAGASPLNTMRAITASGYREIAARRGFPLAGYLPDPTHATRDRGQAAEDCPIILWLESNYWRPGIKPSELARRMGLPPTTDAGYAPEVRRSGDHLLVIFRKKPA